MGEIVPGELRNVDVQFVSLVDRGANGRRFKLFKSADWPDEGETGGQRTDGGEEPEEEVRGLIQTLKGFFTRRSPATAQVEKALPTFAELYSRRQVNDEIWTLFIVLNDTVAQILGAETDEDKLSAVSVAVDQFKTTLLTKLQSIGVQKAAEQLRVEKVGRKIAAARLKVLREAYEAIGSILAEVDSEGKEADPEMTKEEVAKIVDEELQKALAPVMQRVEKLEKPEAQGETKAESAELTQEDVAKLVGEELEKALQPVLTRLEKVEQVRGLGNATQPETAVQKAAPDWGGIFLP